jgi:3-hydroxy-9,10-secoandrosta-1,3,5(10)-triene-9,17-dione monooxygenase reductase component
VEHAGDQRGDPLHDRDPDPSGHRPVESFLDQFDFDDGLPPSFENGRSPQSQRHFRDVLGRFASGVTVVTSTWRGRPVGMTAQSFTSVSLDPPLVLFCPSKTSVAWPDMQRAGFFCVNLLARGQDEIARRFARRADDKFDGVPWHASSTGAPLLSGVLGWVDCTVYAVHEAGDHYVVIGQVQDLGFSEVPHPLLFYRGRYHHPPDR